MLLVEWHLRDAADLQPVKIFLQRFQKLTFAAHRVVTQENSPTKLEQLYSRCCGYLCGVVQL